MVVDDAYSDLKVIENILQSAGHQVLTFLDGDQLEDKVATERPDMVLLDIIMPKRNGYEILRNLKKDERTKATPVVVVSSMNQASDIAWGRRQGDNDYLPKPFTSEQLLKVVEQFARYGRSRAALLSNNGRVVEAPPGGSEAGGERHRPHFTRRHAQAKEDSGRLGILPQLVITLIAVTVVPRGGIRPGDYSGWVDLLARNGDRRTRADA